MDDSNRRLRQAREAAGFESMKAAADRFGWKLSTYRSHENGQTTVPKEAAEAYGPAFGRSPAWILTGEGDEGGVDWMLKGASREFIKEVRLYIEFRKGQST